jgi:hypothetical protein
MAEELDRRLMPDFLQTTLAVSLGFAYKSCEMLLHPSAALSNMVEETKTLLTIPEDAGEGVTDKVLAVAGIWIGEGAAMLEDCKTQGRKFSKGT